MNLEHNWGMLMHCWNGISSNADERKWKQEYLAMLKIMNAGTKGSETLYLKVSG